jgi:hypothetical protein
VQFERPIRLAHSCEHRSTVLRGRTGRRFSACPFRTRRNMKRDPARYSSTCAAGLVCHCR